MGESRDVQADSWKTGQPGKQDETTLFQTATAALKKKAQVGHNAYGEPL